MESVLTREQLKKGDVLLSLGTGKLSELIHLLNGGRYSHGSVYDGDCVIECVADGVQRHTLEELFSHRVFADVYRFKSDSGQHLGDHGWAPQPIINVGLDYLSKGTKYAYDQLLMMGLLIVTRRVPLPAPVRSLARTYIDRAVRLLTDMMARGIEPLTCSEFVYRCFYQAQPAPHYGLTVPGVREPRRFFQMATAQRSAEAFEFQAARTTDDTEAIELLSAAFARRYSALKAELDEVVRMAESDDDAFELQHANPNVVPDFVSPGDLEHSPNLERLGELKLNPHQ